MQYSDIFELIAPPALLKMQESLHELTGLEIRLVTREGIPLFQPDAGEHHNELSYNKKVCTACGTGGPHVLAMPGGGYAAACPIILLEDHLGYWIVADKKEIAEKDLAALFSHFNAMQRAAEQLLLNAGEYMHQNGGLEGEKLTAYLRRRLRQAEKQGLRLAVAVINIDGLAYANSVYGYAFGDRLIENAMDAIRAAVRAEDVIGRLHGDTLVAILPGCDRRMAEKRISRGKDRLGQLKLMGSSETFSFSYGIAENGEIPYQDSDEYVRQILDIAERRMRESRRQAALYYARI